MVILTDVEYKDIMCRLRKLDQVVPSIRDRNNIRMILVKLKKASRRDGKLRCSQGV